MSIAGFPGLEFLYKGFLPTKGKARTEAIADISRYPHTVVIYEAPHRIQTTMEDLMAIDPVVGHRRCVCCREITKLHEEVYRGTVAEYLATIHVSGAIFILYIIVLFVSCLDLYLFLSWCVVQHLLLQP